MSNGLLIGTHQCELSPWDTNYFGIESGRVVLNGPLKDNELRSIEEWALAFDFVTVYNVGNDPISNFILSQSCIWLFLTDVNIKFYRYMANIESAQPLNHDYIFIESESDQDEGVISVAATCFTYSRFYNDPNIIADKARGIYAHWVSSAFNRPDRFFVKAKIHGVTQGFILFSLNLSEKVCVIELIGVCPQASGRGLGLALLNQLALYVSKLGITRIQVGTQLNNLAAVRFYERNGFTYVGCTTVYHMWPKKEHETHTI